MVSRVPYDDFADIYDAWCASAPITEKNGAFYVRKLLESTGPVVELGVGNGRICIEVAKRGKPIVGVDSSGRILELCGKRAREAGVEERLTLVQADFRDFVLSEPAELIVLPFHTIGHLLTEADKLQALTQVRSQLRDGGRFIFDHFLFDPGFVEPGVAYLRGEFENPDTGRDVVLWETSTRDLQKKIIRILAWTDELDERGVVLERRYRRSALSWLSPEESEALLGKAGFEIETHYGDFEENPPGEGSTHQVWVARVR